MTRPLIADAVAHHIWATLRLLDACADLDSDGLAADAPGTFGSVIDTMRHLVGADRAYLTLLSDGALPEVDDSTMSIADLRATMVANGPVWSEVVAADLDPDSDVVRYRDDGSEGHAPLGLRMAQVLHHGSDHRSQVCTILTAAGIEPPSIDVWDFAVELGRYTEVDAH